MFFDYSVFVAPVQLLIFPCFYFPLNTNLTNENNEKFIFGVKDGVRGFYTNPSRADDCFVPFKGDAITGFYSGYYTSAQTLGTYDITGKRNLYCMTSGYSEKNSARIVIKVDGKEVFSAGSSPTSNGLAKNIEINGTTLTISTYSYNGEGQPSGYGCCYFVAI